MSRLSAEAQLLIETASDRDGELPPGLGWSRLLVLAQREGATSIVWRRLRRVSDPRVGSHVVTQWQKLAMVAEFQMVQRQRLLTEILDLLGAHGIRVMLLKGSALACTVYPTFADRPMSDLDVLIPPEQARDAWSLLQRHGWSWPATSWPSARYSAHQHLPPLISTGGDTCLEVHTALLPTGHPFRWPIASVWDQSQQVQVTGRMTLGLRPSHQLLHVCVHFAWSHEMQWGGWRMLRDVGALARNAPIAWPEFVDLARGSRAQTCCFWTLTLAKHLGGASIPTDALTALRPPRPEWVVSRLENHYRRQLFSLERGCPSVALAHALWELGIAPRWSGHGGARPWQGSDRWSGAQRSRPRRLVALARHTVAAIDYLGKVAV